MCNEEDQEAARERKNARNTRALVRKAARRITPEEAPWLQKIEEPSVDEATRGIACFAVCDAGKITIVAAVQAQYLCRIPGATEIVTAGEMRVARIKRFVLQGLAAARDRRLNSPTASVEFQAGKSMPKVARR